MATLLMRLAGPMQSWGTDSRFDIRFTGREPSKSGVIGLLCAALGKPRMEQPGDGVPTLVELAALRMGVRVDDPGVPRVDYQTAGGGRWHGGPYGVAKADPRARPDTVQSWRYYLADADFLVGLESADRILLELLAAALTRPVWQLSLGRKAYVPGVPVALPTVPPLGPGLRDVSLAAALGAYRWPVRHRGAAPERLRLVLETSPEQDAEMRPDVPLDFALRRFGVRWVQTTFIARPAEVSDVPFAIDPEPP